MIYWKSLALTTLMSLAHEELTKSLRNQSPARTVKCPRKNVPWTLHHSQISICVTEAIRNSNIIIQSIFLLLLDGQTEMQFAKEASSGFHKRMYTWSTTRISWLLRLCHNAIFSLQSLRFHTQLCLRRVYHRECRIVWTSFEHRNNHVPKTCRESCRKEKLQQVWNSLAFPPPPNPHGILCILVTQHYNSPVLGVGLSMSWAF